MSCSDCRFESEDERQKSTLVILLSINAVMFISEFICGILADSTGLIADSLDMFADALVYGLSIYAVGRAQRIKVRAARWSGFFQLALAGGVFLDIIRRLLFGSEPEPAFMYVVGAVALAANIICLKLIYRHREGQVHMRASWIFSKNDVIANVGVIVAGITVHFSGARWPDIVIGLAITTIVFRGGLEILRQAATERDPDETHARPTSPPPSAAGNRRTKDMHHPIIITIVAVAFSAAPLYAADEHKHEGKKHDHEEKKVDVKIPESAGALWVEIEARQKAVSDLVAAKKAEGLHEAAESVKILAAAAPAKYPDLAPDKKKRLDGQVKNVARVLDDLHDEGEAGDWETAAKKLSQLEAALKIMKSQVVP